ncbi:MAG: CoB--CoM heterodisulfide reductase iron-sulfur subunit A family protein [Polyangiaceae bacterium]|nr:CoB--CoM heterodisulfide reductase iron-sulfur subunit A family protein [Polyangiaceae bacterium]
MKSNGSRLSQTGQGEPRIAVYICHCGMNIASKVHIDQAREFAEKLPDVVLARDFKFMCSDPGQELILDDVKQHGVNRVVVASCSPLLHEPTFRGALVKAGLNPFYFQMANIREHVSWVTEDKDKATEKSKALIAGAVRRVARATALEKKRVPVDCDVLVVGGGIAGIHAALLMADAGRKVYLVEREPTIGGHMAQFDKTFPTLDCAACILTPKMSAVKNHPNITLWTYSEVKQVSGFAGNFEVRVERKPRYIKEDLCVGCNDCIEACIFKQPKFADEFNVGLSKRKPVYMPFPQATPPLVVIDPATCLEILKGKCKKTCVDACERAAIDFNQKSEFKDIKVGAIVLATGYKTFDPKRIPEYGYGKYPNVYTTLEVERLVNASGPTQGEVVLKDGTQPKSAAIIHCVGSRDRRFNRHCSSVCCMASLKLAHLIHERCGAQVYEFYIDMRAGFKGYEEFYDQVLSEGVQFIRGRPAEVTDWAVQPEEEGKLVVRVEDTLIGIPRRIPVDMVVLAVGIEAQEDAGEVQRRFGISCSRDGFFLERHPKLAPVNTFSDGIYLCGACQGPKDIPETVAQAGAAAGEALALVDRGHVEIEPNTAWIDAEVCSGCKTCIALCPFKAISRDEKRGVAVVNEALCKGCGTCVGACPSGAAQQHLFTNEQIYEELEGVLSYV